MPDEIEKADQAFQLRVTQTFIRQLDDLRRAQVELPSRAEIIKRLVAEAPLQAIEERHQAMSLSHDQWLLIESFGFVAATFLVMFIASFARAEERLDDWVHARVPPPLVAKAVKQPEHLINDNANGAAAKGAGALVYVSKDYHLGAPVASILRPGWQSAPIS